jgi:hypothetical protein
MNTIKALKQKVYLVIVATDDLFTVINMFNLYSLMSIMLQIIMIIIVVVSVINNNNNWLVNGY